MSEEEGISVDSADAQLLTAEYKDGQLQIVQVTPFERDKDVESILPDSISDSGDGSHCVNKFMQVLDPNKGLVQLDLLNLTLVRCDDGEESYRLVSNTDSDGGDLSTDGTVTCVLQSSDVEEHDSQEYVMMDGDQGPLVFLQSSPSSSTSSDPNPKPAPAPPPQKTSEKQISSIELLERVKVLQKAKSAAWTANVRPGRRGRRRAGELPPPHELLASPNFKLYLYSCKLCMFKCNAIKELQAHRAASHGGAGKYRGGGARALVTHQCARCPFRGASHVQLMKHIQSRHLGDGDTITSTTTSSKISLNSKEVEEADVLVCGACGYESSVRADFIKHIEDEHGATTV
ncbi:uncharacterized protein LOC126378470 isoform X2 [Pectinophora gossypiella]|uniref:uncharacterized protein LOC126378470 isoform X2 n=1 Tax=Pectinophora gossypiella TaxID=13191 RepID=UPI00214EC553|nr:uncharacterized protein LOC126378470 isoform X2 [Pectinophora gossypiella]